MLRWGIEESTPTGRSIPKQQTGAFLMSKLRCLCKRGASIDMLQPLHDGCTPNDPITIDIGFFDPCYA